MPPGPALTFKEVLQLNRLHKTCALASKNFNLKLKIVAKNKNTDMRNTSHLFLNINHGQWKN